ncbi:hypothetical protein CQW23_06390 [Capsicum baccatum]|uniref:NB-ARC domain-containing protein n=1 Tax=Capsicum baccatum TaxID=33114 RepID=A0A2G2X366_CAPBA|nr:hypothetical protein CQW23_06390 [Capsicum baccatum]
MNDIVLEVDSGWRYLSMQNMQPFKRVTGDEIDYCPFGLYRALLTPVHSELPNLEVLKLMTSAFGIEEWYTIVREFTRLKFLLIDGNYLKYWKATNDNFPVLEHLMIRSNQILKEIPIEFSDIHTLQLIELRDYTPKLGESATRI